MLEDHAELLELPISIDLFHRLPFQPAYRCEYYDNRAVLSYRGRASGVRLRLAPGAPVPIRGDATIRPFDVTADIDPLIGVFVAAFSRMPPVDTMSDARREVAARAALAQTREGGDGELIADASFVALEGDRLVGAIIVTRSNLRYSVWPDSPRPDTLPNLTWIFVTPWMQRRQIASGLLAKAADRLIGRGESWLTSHFLNGNAASMLFHWRQGFELLPDAFSLHRRPID